MWGMTFKKSLKMFPTERTIEPYEWNPILTSNMDVYVEVRLNGTMLEIKPYPDKDIVMRLDAKCIPQLIKILQKMENRI
jgi:hypothetical protein